MDKAGDNHGSTDIRQLRTLVMDVKDTSVEARDNVSTSGSLPGSPSSRWTSPNPPPACATTSPSPAWDDPLFADDAIARLHRVANGLPRALNNAAAAALIAAAAAGKDLVDDACAKKAVAELTRD